MEWAIFGGVFFLGLVALGLFAESIRQKRKIQRQELIQKERLIAMEKGLPVPDWDLSMMADDGQPVSPEIHARRMQWFRFLTLCVGLVITLGGIGMLVGFNFSTEPGFKAIATLGFIPIMTGLGLLLFYFLTRGLQK